MHLEPSCGALRALPLSSSRALGAVVKKHFQERGRTDRYADLTGPAVTWVVNPSLDDIIQRKSTGSLFVPQLLVQVQGQHLGHVIVVGAQVGELISSRVLHLQEVVAV